MRPFGEWMPDIPPIENNGLTVAKNVVPGGSAYLPLPQPTVISQTQLNARPQGGITVRDVTNSGTNHKYIGTDTKLYELEDTTWTDLSAFAYSTADEDVWEFVQWDNTVIATNFTDVIQEISIGAGIFTSLAGTPPKARHMAIVADFLVLGNTWDATDGYQPHRIRWSGLDNKDTWTVSSSTQADFNDLDGGDGWVERVVGGRYGYVFQSSAITRMSYVGSPLVFQLDKVETKRGALAGGSVVQIGDNIAYLSADGFFVFNGQSSIPIGNNKVDDTFFNDNNNV
jgi:hypothetical protein